MEVKVLFVASFSVLMLLIGIGRSEARMPWRGPMGRRPKDWEEKEWNDSEKRGYRKKEYKMILLFWAILTVGAIIYVTFFWNRYYW